MRKLVISYRTITPVYPCGDRSIIRDHCIVADEDKSVGWLLDRLRDAKSQYASDWRILGEAEVPT